ncbi:MAG: glycosyltransferase family 39 protein [Anaerolineae bacterium]
MAAVIVLTLVGFALRVHRLDFQPLWGDEGWSFHFAALPAPELLASTAIDIHPPLYYLLLKGWLALAGNGPAPARLFSVLSGTLLIPLMYATGRRLLDRAGGLAAAGVTAVAPFAIYYSQEVRMYGLVTLLGLASMYFFSRSLGAEAAPAGSASGSLAASRASMLAHTATTAAALYTMYYAVFIPILQAVYLLVRCRRGAARQRLMRSMLIAGGLYLPWVLYAGPRLATYVQGKRLADADAPLLPLAFLYQHLVAFSLGHLPDTLLPYSWMSLAFAGVALLGLGLLQRREDRRWLLGLYLALPLILGWGVNLLYPFNPRFYERTLMLAAPAWWLLVGLGLVWVWRRQYLLFGTIASLLLLVSLVSLQGFYAVPRYPDEDYRPLLAQISAVATPEDTVLASYQWQLGYYWAYLPRPRPRIFPVPGWGEAWSANPDSLRRDLTGILAESPRLWFPAYQLLGHKWEDEAEAAIAELAYPAGLNWFGTSTTKVTLAGAARPSIQAEVDALNFGGMVQATDIRLGSGPYPSGRGVIPVDVTWRKLGSLGREHRISLRLVDEAGRTWASRDSHPRAGQVHLVDLAEGQSLADRHGLRVPAGTPPGRYQLRLSLRRDDPQATPIDLLDEAGQPLGAEAILGEIEVVPPDPPLGPAALPVAVERPAIFEGRVKLLGFSLDEGPFKAGDVVNANLFWESQVDSPGNLTLFAQLQDENGRPQALVERPPLYPTGQWSRGTLLRDPVEILLPAAMRAGTYRLAVGWLEPDKRRLSTAQGTDQVVLGTVTVETRPHLFEAPSPQYTLAARFADKARLVGYDLPATEAGPGDTLSLTLYWQPLDTFRRSWKVFAHLIDAEDNIAGQRDQLPGAGQFPTTGWLPPEFIIDSRDIPISASAPPGQYLLEVGLYDPVTLERLPVSIEKGPLLGDRLLLDKTPIEIK